MRLAARNPTQGELIPASARNRRSPLRCPTLGDVCQAQGSNGGPGFSGSNGKQFNHDNYDQEVNDTNTDPVSPIATGRLEKGVNQR